MRRRLLVRRGARAEAGMVRLRAPAGADADGDPRARREVPRRARQQAQDRFLPRPARQPQDARRVLRDGARVLDLCCNSGGFAHLRQDARRRRRGRRRRSRRGNPRRRRAEREARTRSRVRFVQADIFAWLRDVAVINQASSVRRRGARSGEDDARSRTGDPGAQEIPRHEQARARGGEAGRDFPDAARAPAWSARSSSSTCCAVRRSTRTARCRCIKVTGAGPIIRFWRTCRSRGISRRRSAASNDTSSSPQEAGTMDSCGWNAICEHELDRVPSCRRAHDRP